MRAKYINETIKHLKPKSKADLAAMGIKLKSTKNIDFTIGKYFNQFSFSKYGNENFSEYRNYPIFKEDSLTVLVTPFKWISDIPIYQKQLELIIDAIKQDFLELKTIDIYTLKEVSISYNNYGSLFMLWKVTDWNEAIFDRIIEMCDNDEWNQGNVEELAYKFNDINTDNDFVEINNAKDLERFLTTEKELGYTLSDVSDIQDMCELDEKTIERVRNKVAKKRLK